MNKLYIVSLVYAPYQIQVSVFSVWAKDDDTAENLAKLYKSEGEIDKDWSEYEIETVQIEGTSSRKTFKGWNDEEGWIGHGSMPVEEIFHWSRG